MRETTAILAEDEEALRAHLREALARVWPELRVAGEARNGHEALALIERLGPDVVFLDIKMPGLSGLEVARRIAGRCRIVFVTAYDQYALEAFEREALDYLLKPVVDERLEKTRARMSGLLAQAPPAPAESLVRVLDDLAHKLDLGAPRYLTWVKALERDRLQLIAVDEVRYFRSDDKYTIVITAGGEAIIRTPLRQLAVELDPTYFWQIHRSLIVNARFIERVVRDFRGRYTVHIKGRDEALAASRGYADVFKQM